MRICNFPISKDERCTQSVADGEPNCGRHGCEISAEQLGPNPTVYRKRGKLYVWAGEPDDVYCLVHNSTAYQALCRRDGKTPRCCLQDDVYWGDEDGYYHRDDGPAEIWRDGTQFWYQHGEQHRDGGPAIIWMNGTQIWYQHDQRHRDDGPAVIRSDGTKMWYWHGEEVTERKHAKLRKRHSRRLRRHIQSE